MISTNVNYKNDSPMSTEVINFKGISFFLFMMKVTYNSVRPGRKRGGRSFIKTYH